MVELTGIFCTLLTNVGGHLYAQLGPEWEKYLQLQLNTLVIQVSIGQ